MAADPARVLIVDDQSRNLASMEAILAPLGQIVIKAGSGREALKLVLEHEFAVILLDVKMPEMDGFETAELIRARDVSRHVPIIFLTAHDRDREHILKGYALGAVDFIYKPIEVDEIIRSKVRVFVQLHAAKEKQRVLEREQRHVQELQAALEQYQNMAQVRPLAVGEAMFGAKPLAKQDGQTFAQCVERYGRALDLALESRGLNIEHDVPARLQQLADDLGFMRAGPRDVVEIHTQALAASTSGAPATKAKALVEEGRFRVLELMGNLVSYYRKYYTGVEHSRSRQTKGKPQ